VANEISKARRNVYEFRNTSECLTESECEQKREKKKERKEEELGQTSMFQILMLLLDTVKSFPSEMRRNSKSWWKISFSIFSVCTKKNANKRVQC
jgi:predicted nucleic acid-binding protein